MNAVSVLRADIILGKNSGGISSHLAMVTMVSPLSNAKPALPNAELWNNDEDCRNKHSNKKLNLNKTFLQQKTAAAAEITVPSH